jgi:hypothetical protein
VARVVPFDRVVDLSRTYLSGNYSGPPLSWLREVL